MNDPPSWALANAVSAYATILSGLMALALTALTHRHPSRWVAVYAGIVVTGVATVWYHGFGEEFAAAVADIGTNLLLAWLLQVAVLADHFSSATRRGVAAASRACTPSGLGPLAGSTSARRS